MPLPLSGVFEQRVAVSFLTYAHHKNPPSRMIAKRVGATIAAVGGPSADASTVVEVLVLVLVLVVLVVLIVIVVMVVLLAVVVVVDVMDVVMVDDTDVVVVVSSRWL